MTKISKDHQNRIISGILNWEGQFLSCNEKFCLGQDLKVFTKMLKNRSTKKYCGIKQEYIYIYIYIYNNTYSQKQLQLLLPCGVMVEECEIIVKHV